MKLKCIIVDDEPGAQSVLENYIGRLDEIELAGKFSNAVDAFKFLKTIMVDVMLLDINMPEVDGFELLDLLEIKPAVIITTAYSDFALEGFEYGAVDYLHKPIRFERFVKAMEKAAKWCSVKPVPKNGDYIELKIDGRRQAVKLGDVYYAESFRNYIKIHTVAKDVLLLMTISELERKLPNEMFIRIHKSYIINKQRIENAAGDKVMVKEILLPVGKTYKKYFEEFLRSEEGKGYL